jgi:lysine-N-methylase
LLRRGVSAGLVGLDALLPFEIRQVMLRLPGSLEYMSTVRRSILTFDYLPAFACTNSACEEICCTGWEICIDRETLELYDQLDDATLTPLFCSAIERYQLSESNPAKSAAFKRDPHSGCCAFLTGRKLCLIHERLGEYYLASACQRYPRQDSLVDGMRERSLTLSCLPAARLVLCRREPLARIQIEAEGTRWDYLFTRAIKTTDLPALEVYKAYFFRIRDLTIRALQQRTQPFADRLLMVGIMCQELERLIQEKSFVNIGDHLDAFESELNSPGGLSESLAEIKPLPEVQLLMLRLITAQSFKSGISHAGLAGCYTQFFEGIDGGKIHSEKEFLGRYSAALETYYRPFMASHEHMLENWCVNDVFRTLFPFDEKGSVFDQYALLASKVALAKYFLVGMGAYSRGLSEEMVARLIQALSRGFEASKCFRENIIGLLESHGLRKLSSLAILLKD